MNIPVYQLRKRHNEKMYLHKIKSIIVEGSICLDNPAAVADFVNKEFDLCELAEEELYAIYVSESNNTQSVVRLSHGGINFAAVCIQSLLRHAFLCSATGFVLVHNHPTGNSTPSVQDKVVSEEIREGCDLVGLRFIDHIIIGNEVTSLRQQGVL